MTKKQEVEKLVKLIRPYPIQYLYKYRAMDSSTGLQGIFEERKVFLNDAAKFNDPFECRPYLTVDGSSIAQTAFLEELTKDRFPNASRAEIKNLMRGKGAFLRDHGKLRKAYDEFVTTVGIYCLSEKKDDLLMWAHYSDSHRGLCLEFEASTEGSLFWEAFRVVYQDEYPIVNMMRIGEAEEFRKALLTKSTHWAYEQERRVLKMEDEGGAGDYYFPPAALTGVIFGALMSSRDKEIVKNWIKAYPSEIAIYQATLNGHGYQLDVNKIT
ncbi:MAG: DUF2971 domain-containing protein [Syntrophus sp. (in: bacteria)]